MSQKVTGYQLREALKRWVMRRDTASKQFNETLFQFEEDKNPSDFTPEAVAGEFRKADEAVATIEAAQQAYNLKVSFKVQGQDMTLSYAVKRVGGAGRLDKMWRSAATDTGEDRYSIRNKTRQEGERRAQKMIAPTKAMSIADEAARFAGALRAEIAKANATEVALAELGVKIDPALLS